MRKNSILVLDDQPFYQEIFRSLIEQYPQLTLVAVASDATNGLKLIRELEPDIIILDINLPGITGLELLPVIRTAFPTVKILCISSYDYLHYVKFVFENGGQGYITKATLKEEFFTAINNLIMGKTFLSSDIDWIKYVGFLKDQ